MDSQSKTLAVSYREGLRVVVLVLMAISGTSLFVAGIGKLSIQDELPIFGAYVLPHRFVPWVGILEATMGALLVFWPKGRWVPKLGALFFAAFLVVLVGRWLHDAPFCNCFPAIEMPVWVMMLFDSMSLVACAIAGWWFVPLHSEPGVTDRIGSLVLRAGRSMIYAFGFLGLFALVSSWSFEHVLAVFSGQVIGVDQSRRARFIKPDGEIIEVPFLVHNLGSSPLAIIGAKSSCGCTAIEGLPVQIVPKESFALKLRVATDVMDGKSRGTFSTDVFFSDLRKPVRLTVDLFASK